MQNKIYIANFKMYFSYTQAVDWVTDNAQELAELARTSHLIVCPDYTVLPTLQTTLRASSTNLTQPHITYGAQNCAAYTLGAYTGEVSAQTLKELGCTYCIVGHSERRTLYGETTAVCAQKIALLQAQGITPIYCIGEHASEAKDPYNALTEQLQAITQTQAPLIVAYEPVWSIGTGRLPTVAELAERIAFIKKHIHAAYPILYGGSVTAKTSQELKTVDGLDGFLIGKASTDFQELKKIVLS